MTPVLTAHCHHRYNCSWASSRTLQPKETKLFFLLYEDFHCELSTKYKLWAHPNFRQSECVSESASTDSKCGQKSQFQSKAEFTKSAKNVNNYYRVNRVKHEFRSISLSLKGWKSMALSIQHKITFGAHEVHNSIIRSQWRSRGKNITKTLPVAKRSSREKQEFYLA